MKSLVLSNFKAVSVTVSPDAITTRDNIVAQLNAIRAVASQAEYESAVTVLQQSAKITREVEAARKDVKAPVLELGKDIDTKAKSYVEPLTKTTERVTGLVNAYTAEQRRIAAEAEAKRIAELQRIERERQEAERIERERLAEIERQQKAAIRAAQEAESPEQFEAAKKQQEELARKQAEAAQAAEDERKKQAQMRLSALQQPPVVFTKAAGVQTRERWRFEVTDINALLQARPDLVKVEPKTAEINRAIDGGKQIPGLRVWSESQTIVKS